MLNIKRKFHRKTGPAGFIRILASQLIMRERISTTDIRARELRPIVERLVTIAKCKKLIDLRLLLSRLPEKAAMKLYHELGPKYAERKGGYLRIVKESGFRKRDGARTATIEFV